MAAEQAHPDAPEEHHVTYGRFRLTARIGIGGMAEVFRAVVKGPEGWERELVVKRILPQLSGDAEFVRLFIKEAKISALLSHPNIVQTYEFGEAEGTYFIAMESVQGVTLRHALTTLKREQRAMPFMVTADIARQICTGLDYAHTLRSVNGTPLEIVHQDISPTNVMLAYNGTAKILDFGIARATAFADHEPKKGMVRGKVSYLAPEQARLLPFDHRADIFALGSVMHEMLTGVRLFPARNDIGRLKELLAQPILAPSAVNAAVPRELDRIVAQALEIDPAKRYPSAAAMAADLERTIIAARYSSRDLSKLLHGLFLPPEDPLVLIEGQSGPSPAPPAGSTSIETIASTERVRPIRDENRDALSGAIHAERSRLVRDRWSTRVRLALGAVALAGAVVLGLQAFRRYAPLLLAHESAAPQVQVVEPEPANEEQAAAAATSAKKRPRPAKPAAPSGPE